MDPEVLAPDAAPVEVPDPASTTSLSEHEAQHPVKSRADKAKPAAAPVGTDDVPSSEADAAAGERDESGRFKPRHRAQSQKASAADVPRIQELTRRLRETEAERDALRTPRAPQPAPAPVQQRPTQPPPAAAAPRLQQFIDALKPDEDYNIAVERHADAVGDWKLSKWEQQQHQRAAEQQFARTFADKVNTAKAKYADFEAVALSGPSHIPPGSVPDRWVWEHKAGADVLYHFQKNPAELQQVLALPLLDQLESLTLLSQRLTAPSSRAQAVSTGSAAPPVVTPAPRPPNPVRTGPMRSGDDPPDADKSSLREFEKFYYEGKRRRG